MAPARHGPCLSSYLGSSAAASAARGCGAVSTDEVSVLCFSCLGLGCCCTGQNGRGRTCPTHAWRDFCGLYGHMGVRFLRPAGWRRSVHSALQSAAAGWTIRTAALNDRRCVPSTTSWTCFSSSSSSWGLLDARRTMALSSAATNRVQFAFEFFCGAPLR